MRDILPFHFNRLDRKVIFVDPKNEFLRRKRNVDILGKPGKGRGKIIYPIEDEAHTVYDPETEKILNKLRTVGQRKRGN